VISLSWPYSEAFTPLLYHFSTSRLAKDRTYPISAAFDEEWLVSYITLCYSTGLSPICSGKQIKLLAHLAIGLHPLASPWLHGLVLIRLGSAACLIIEALTRHHSRLVQMNPTKQLWTAISSTKALG
jgi:hypothetical protein